jgi:hypothetical protein
MTLGGTFVALVGILVVAHGIDEEKAKNVIMICAACWTGSTGYVYSSLLKDKVKLSEAAPKQA